MGKEKVINLDDGTPVKRLSDGSFIVGEPGGNIHTDHIHLCSDLERFLRLKSNNVPVEKAGTYSDFRKELNTEWKTITNKPSPFEDPYWRKQIIEKMKD